MSKYSAPYQLWLQNHHYSASTIRNYVVDLNKFFQSSKIEDLNNFSDSQVESYLTSISSDPNYSRYLASLNKFFDFALDQKLIQKNPLKKILKQKNESSPTLTVETLISQYEDYLIKKKFSSATIKNYIADIQQFISWSQNQPNGDK